MEEINDPNLEEVKKYLKANGIDEKLADTPVFVEKFSKDVESLVDGIPSRLIVYMDRERNVITPYFRDIQGLKVKQPEISIKKEGKMILIEELSNRQDKVHYSIDDPTGEDVKKNTIRKQILYVDESGEDFLAEETREYSRLNDGVSEEDLYSEPAEVNYKINEEYLKTKKTSDFPFIMMMKKVEKLENNLERISGENSKLKEMLEKSLDFAEKVRDSAVGRLFFGKKAKDVLGDKNKKSQRLPERTNSYDEMQK